MSSVSSTLVGALGAAARAVAWWRPKVVFVVVLEEYPRPAAVLIGLGFFLYAASRLGRHTNKEKG